MDETTTKTNKAFREAMEAADIISQLMDGAVTMEVDSETGTLTFEGFTVHLQDGGTQRVTSGVTLVASTQSPTEAVIEAVTGAIAMRTREELRKALSS
jgi:hypothetical protein